MRGRAAGEATGQLVAPPAIELDEAASAWLAEKGYDRLYGARPLARVIQDRIKRPLADELLFGRLAKGGKVYVTIAGDQPVFHIVPAGDTALLPPPEDGSDEDTGEDQVLEPVG